MKSEIYARAWIFIAHTISGYLRPLLVALPKEQTVDDYEAFFRGLLRCLPTYRSAPTSIPILHHHSPGSCKGGANRPLTLARLPTHPASRIDDLLPHRWAPAS